MLDLKALGNYAAAARISEASYFIPSAICIAIFPGIVNNRNNKGLQIKRNEVPVKTPALQAIFCIDDRECSIRRHVENVIEGSETFGSAGFFNAEFYFQPEHGNFYTKVCPAPLKNSPVLSPLMVI
jgi:uncharacterized protein YbcC (UPF0753/DUF2309 family)